MLNILSYIGVNLQSELCLWTLVGLLRTIFDATLFKVNANLKQVWQMSMPPELPMPVQRGLRTMISGVMLVQCFTVYVYLAAYIVLLYPVFLEERPNLVLPWLLLAAIRKFLCELTSLALGLGACVLLGPARPPCVKFVVFKIASITPAFYMWMLVYSYYNTLKIASAFKRFPAVIVSSDHNYGLELAIRRRRTKSLFGEEQLRRKLVANLNYGERSPPLTLSTPQHIKCETPTRMVHSTHATFDDIKAEMKFSVPFHVSVTERVLSDLGSYEDWCGGELIVPRNSDRILEQFVTIMLRIGTFLKTDGTDPEKLFGTPSVELKMQSYNNNLDCSNINEEDTDTPPQVGSTKGKTASYLQEYPQIFMKKTQESLQLQNEKSLNPIQNTRIDNLDSKGNVKCSGSNILDDPNGTVKLKTVKIMDNANEGRESLNKSSNTKQLEYNLKPNQSQTQPEDMLKVDPADQTLIFSESLINQLDITDNFQTKTDLKDTSLHKSSSIDKLELEPKLNISEPKSEVERDLKQVSVETYNSINQEMPLQSNRIRDEQIINSSPLSNEQLLIKDARISLKQKDSTNITIKTSDNSLESILERMRKNLPDEMKSLEQHETTVEADKPTSTNVLNKKGKNDVQINPK